MIVVDDGDGRGMGAPAARRVKLVVVVRHISVNFVSRHCMVVVVWEVLHGREKGDMGWKVL